MEHVGLKNSAREQCLSAFARSALHRQEPRRLRWTFADEADWSADGSLRFDHPLYQRLPLPLRSGLRMRSQTELGSGGVPGCRL